MIYLCTVQTNFQLILLNSLYTLTIVKLCLAGGISQSGMQADSQSVIWDSKIS